MPRALKTCHLETISGVKLDSKGWVSVVVMAVVLTAVSLVVVVVVAVVVAPVVVLVTAGTVLVVVVMGGLAWWLAGAVRGVSFSDGVVVLGLFVGGVW